MADIFLSYSSTDRLWVARFAEALVKRGWSVFWDRQIPVGKQFDQVIEQELGAAKCIIVLWSQGSIASNWVKEEAEEGARRGVLCPVLIEDVRVPMGLRRFQAANLAGWQEGIPHPEFDRLMEQVAIAVVRKSASRMPAADTQTLVGKRVQNYQVIALLGQGGMGAVYQAVHPILGRQVAIKILRREYAEDPKLVDRFINEAKAANAIRHAGIVDVIDVGTLDGGLPYLVMELLAGETVRARLGQGRMSVAHAVDIARQSAEALAAAHAVGIVHRDVKPENLFLVPAGVGRERLKVLDFGIAKLTNTGFMVHAEHTRTGMVMGTPPYMSPEQCRGSGEIDHRTDVYALGIILFEMLTGQQPFKAAGFGDLLMLHMTAAPPVPRSLNPDIPPEVEAAILRSLAKRPEDRFQHMLDFARALTEATRAEDDVAAPAAVGVMAGGTHVMTGGTHVMTGGTHVMTGGTRVMTDAAPSTPTTMTDAASEARRPPRGAGATRTRRQLLLGAAASVVVGAGAILIARWPRRQPAPQPPPFVQPLARDGGARTISVVDRKDAGPPIVPDQARKSYPIAVSVRPAGAAIELDGARVGIGAFARQIAADGASHTLRFRHKGYVERTVVFGEAVPPPSLIVLDRRPKVPPPPTPIGPIDTTPLGP